MTSAVLVAPVEGARNGDVRPGLRTAAIGVLLAGGAAGALVGWAAGMVDQDQLLKPLTGAALFVPSVVAALRGRRWPAPCIPVLVGLVVMYVLLPGLLGATASSGLVSDAGLTVAEFRRGDQLAQLLVLAFLLPLVAVLANRRSYRRHARPVTGPARLSGPTVVLGRPALVVGVAAAVLSLLNGLRYGVEARVLAPGSGGALWALLVTSATFIPAALWLANQRLACLLLLPLSLAGSYLQGGRQDVLTPLVYLLLALLAQASRSDPASRRARVKTLIGVGVLVVLTVTAVVTVTATKRTPTGDAQASSAVDSLVGQQSQYAPLVVAVVREPHPQWFSVYGRALAAPIPRALWPDKPLSYDYAFRARHFPQYDGAIPISLVGTAYLSFGVPGVLGAGLLIGVLAMFGARLLQHRDPRSVLLAGSVLLLAGDIMRVGGLYREVLTFVLPAGMILLLTRRTATAHGCSPFPLAPPDRRGLRSGGSVHAAG